ncbi:MAG: LacI family transcriptional regulator [Propionibacteriaceae bacterium]|jgi:LacI family transcriptional regulator|nr:LacI family transcriptional regulator [Propionibacteriaceae bacterium]
MTTIKDIAREAGVSVSTVSRVLAGHRDVSATTASHVQEVIDQYQFFVNRNARNLKQSTTMAILVMVKGRHNALFASMLEHVQQAVTATGHTVVTQYLDEDGNEVAEAERLVGEIKPRGVMFLGGDADHVASSADRIGPGCPAVVLTNSVAQAGRLAVSSVTTDDCESARLAVGHLLSHGHTRIGVIGGNTERSTISRHRYEGIVAALDDAGIEFDRARQYVDTRYSLGCGYEAAARLIEQVGGMTAIYAVSDIMALGAMRALYDLGRRVPDNISIIGHDGIELASYVVPKLVTIRQPQEAMAVRGVSLLMNHLSGELDAVEELVPVDVVTGESVRTI